MDQSRADRNSALTHAVALRVAMKAAIGIDIDEADSLRLIDALGDRGYRISVQRSNRKDGIYTASRTEHAHRWRALREAGLDVCSTWIDEAGSKESRDLNDLWRRCFDEVAKASAFLLYREEGEALKGAWIELGVALTQNVPVFAVGIQKLTIAHDLRIRHCATLEDAVTAIRTHLESQEHST